MVAPWFLIAGALLLGVALLGSYVQRLPLSTAMVYLAAGYALGPGGFGLLRFDLVEDSHLLERLTEIAVIVSLFTAGLKLRLPLADRRWMLPLRLAFVSMAITVLGIAAAAVYGMGFSWGAAILLGAILAPTDPVLASDVQVEHEFDDDPLRFSLTGEAGFNDGTAFPFVMLGLGLLGLHEIGEFGWRWVAIDVVWAILGGLAIGALLGTAVGHLVLYLRREHREAVGLDDFLAMGLIAVAYGLAILCYTYGFLAVFAAGLGLRRLERRHTPGGEAGAAEAAREVTEEAAVDPEKAPAVMAKAVLEFNEQLERLGELAVVVVIGSMLAWRNVPAAALWFFPLLFFVIRPVSVAAGLAGAGIPPHRLGLFAWFGIRGIGSLYYLAYSVVHGLDPKLAQPIAGLTLAAIAVSVMVHGASVTPLMKRYARDSSPAPGPVS